MTEADLVRMHGIGSKAISQLRDAFAAAGLSFATENLNQAPALCSRAVL